MKTFSSTDAKRFITRFLSNVQELLNVTYFSESQTLNRNPLVEFLRKVITDIDLDFYLFWAVRRGLSWQYSGNHIRSCAAKPVPQPFELSPQPTVGSLNDLLATFLSLPPSHSNTHTEILAQFKHLHCQLHQHNVLNVHRVYSSSFCISQINCHFSPGSHL